MADDFESGAELTVSVTDSSLRNARRTIEQELGNIEVGVTASVAGGGQQPRDPQTGQFMQIEGVEQRVVDLIDVTREANEMDNRELRRRRQELRLSTLQTSYQEQMVDLLGGISNELEEGALAGGGGGGGGGGPLGIGAGGLAARAGGALSGTAATAGGALAATGTAIFGGQAALSGGALGETGQRVVEGRRRFQGPGAMQEMKEDPLGAIGTNFAQSIDPTGIGETLARDLAAKVGVDDLIGEAASIDPEVPDIDVDDLIEAPLALDEPDIPSDLGVDELIEDTLSIDEPSFPSEITVDDVMNFLFDGSGGGGRTGPGQIPGSPGGAGVNPTFDISVEAVTEDVQEAVDEAEKIVNEELSDFEKRLESALGGLR